MWKWFVLALNMMMISLNAHQLVNLRTHNPFFIFGGTGEAFLVKEVAIQLSRVQRDLAKDGIALIILRAYIPESLSPSCRFDTDKDLLSHTFSRGTAVDVSMEYISGNPLKLPCPPYTWFISPDYGESTCCQCCALQFLERHMLRHGFIRSEKVWWHFEYRNWCPYPPLNIFPDLVSKP